MLLEKNMVLNYPQCALDLFPEHSLIINFVFGAVFDQGGTRWLHGDMFLPGHRISNMISPRAKLSAAMIGVSSSWNHLKKSKIYWIFSSISSQFTRPMAALRFNRWSSGFEVDESLGWSNGDDPWGLHPYALLWQGEGVEPPGGFRETRREFPELS